MLIVTRTVTEWPDDGPVEIVERKGHGHPDTLCDAIAERVCVALCNAYIERFGTILHHNVDKVLLVGGSAHPRFGGGEVTAPIEIYLAGRATTQWRGVTIPVDELAIAACREVLAERIPLHPNVRVLSRIHPGSEDLTSMFARGDVPLANDTSFGVGFAPLTVLEQTLLEVARTLADPAVCAARPYLGADTKIMGVRYRDRVDLTVACAFIDRHLESLDAYLAACARTRALVLDAASRVAAMPVSVVVNAGDDDRSGAVYLTVTGTSAEAGDDGEAGRGNRASGLITPYRPMTLEATAGKNPVTHTGKLYSVSAANIARTITAELPETGAATCTLLSRIGARVDEPALADIALDIVPGDRARAMVTEIVRGELAALPRVRADLLAGRTRLF